MKTDLAERRFLPLLLLSLVLFLAGARLSGLFLTRTLTLVAAGIAAALALTVFLVRRAHAAAQLAALMLNGFANGLAAAALYADTAEKPLLGALLLAALPALLAVIFSLLLSFLPPWRWVAWLRFSLCGALGIGCILLWILTAKHLFGMALLALLIALFSLILIQLDASLRNAAIGSFGLLLLILFIVLVVISEGDALDFSDCDCSEGRGGRRRKNPPPGEGV